MAATGKVREAKKIVKDLISNTDPEHKRILGAHYVSLGEIYRIGKDFDSAAVLYEKALDLDRDFNRLITLGSIYNELEKYDTALIILEEAMSKYDFGRYNLPAASVECHYYLGVAYEGTGRDDEAIAQYETFLDIWKNADEGLKSVEDARRRLAHLRL
jgi:tetratricopeptide (TPR) repeat protein